MDTDKIYAEAIVNEYTPKDTSKVIALKKLDKKVKLIPNILAYTLGVISTLILGTGMCLSMKVIGDGSVLMVTIGIVIGIVAMILMGLNALIYKKFLESRKKKYACDIITLAKEVAGEEK